MVTNGVDSRAGRVRGAMINKNAGTRGTVCTTYKGARVLRTHTHTRARDAVAATVAMTGGWCILEGAGATLANTSSPPAFRRGSVDPMAVVTRRACHRHRVPGLTRAPSGARSRQD